MTYKTSLDNLTKSITIAVTLLFGSIIVSQFFLMRAELPIFVPIIVTLFLLLVYIGTYVFSPQGYTLNVDGLTIHRYYSDVHIPMENIKSVEIIAKESMKWTIRTFGVGGLFGYYGNFTNRKFGSMIFYATRRNNFPDFRAGTPKISQSKNMG
jgi:hypothetical protein